MSYTYQLLVHASVSLKAEQSQPPAHVLQSEGAQIYADMNQLMPQADHWPTAMTQTCVMQLQSDTTESCQ